MIVFEGGSTESLREEFQERKEYKDYEGFNNFETIDTHYKDFQYGVLNRNYEPITLISEQAEESLANFPDLADEIRALPFVVEAFLDFREDYLDFVENSQNPTVSYVKYIANVVPKVGYLNFSTEFAKYMNYNLRIHKGLFVSDPEITNFDIFVDKMLAALKETAREFPITKSGFSLSRHCSIMTTGLCIELADEEYELDQPKGEMVLTPDFECFAQRANQYGFLIDKNAPWRIVADLNSEKMQEYMLKGKNIAPERALDFYETSYTTKSCYDDLFLMRDYLFQIYYALYRNAGGTTTGPPTGKLKTIPPLSIPRLLQILFDVRSMELGIVHEDPFAEKQKIVDLYNKYGLRYMEGYIGKMGSDKLRKVYGPNDTTDTGYKR
tara:strand:- start:1513 stop:2658 length:1146 start_codon:yes stop_codon:yes gene_type:complete